MELFHLRYFMTVAKLKNFSRAAEELNISQPSVSKAVGSLEKELGVSLFTRKGKRVQLNETGLALKQRLEPIMSILDNLPNDLKTIAGASHSTVVMNSLVGSPLLADILAAFRRKHPFIDFKILRNSRSTKCDLCIHSSLTDTVPENAHPILNEEILLAVPMTSHLALEDSVRLRDLRDETFVMMMKGSAIREIGDYYFSAVGFTPRIGIEVDSPGTASGFVDAGLGISLWPEITWGKLATENIRLIHISDPFCHRSIYATCDEPDRLNEQTRLFLDFLIDYFRKVPRV